MIDRSKAKRGTHTLVRALMIFIGGASTFFSPSASADDGYELWLKYRKVADPGVANAYRTTLSTFAVIGTSKTGDIIRDELKRALHAMLGKAPSVVSENDAPGILVATPGSSAFLRSLGLDAAVTRLGEEGFLVRQVASKGKRTIVVTARDESGLLYGSFHLLRLLQLATPLDGLDISSVPKIRLRLLNHWDNVDGTVERGYAGNSLWKWDELPGKLDPRYTDYARANASIGINATVVNNVNANPAILKRENLRKVAALADLFRPYGIKVFLSVNFSSPLSTTFHFTEQRKGGIGDLQTADPLDTLVRAWWKAKTAEIYAMIPDFGGFLVKANSEGMPGPRDYGRSHAEGANMLAEALEPHGGIVMWRAFVYDAAIDPDRTKRAYAEFVPLDGQFRSNVFIQAKNGPLDFQPREPVQPIFGAMKKTPTILELQVTQEYLGHSTHLVYLAPMWKEYLQFDLMNNGPGTTLASVIDGTQTGHPLTAIAGVANTGTDRNWTGHLFAQANWYAYGRLAWDHGLSAEQIADEWVRVTLTQVPEAVQSIKGIMMGSWEACVSYMTPLGLHHIMQEDFHYGPQPSFDKAREDWTSVYYHRADAVGIGYDRSPTGSNAVEQYAPPLRERFGRRETCPEEYLLWFHHVPWDHRLRPNVNLWQALCDRYNDGVATVEATVKQWDANKRHIDPQVFVHVRERLVKQVADAGVWRDTCLQYFQTFSRMPITSSTKK